MAVIGGNPREAEFLVKQAPEIADAVWEHRLSGPCDATLRDMSSPLSWVGVAPKDKVLLERWLYSGGRDVLEFHTDVPVGRTPVLKGEMVTAGMQRMVDRLYPRRIDCCVRMKAGWWLIECKPLANHYVLGQILCYGQWWLEFCRDFFLSRLVVVTDRCDEDVAPVLGHFGVHVIEVGMNEPTPA